MGRADPPRRGPARPVLAAAIVVTVAAIDQATKAWAVAVLPGDPRVVVGDLLELRLARNRGGAFGLFEGYTAALAVLAVVVSVIVVRLIRRTSHRGVVVALSLILGGALGNLADRLFRTPGVLRGAVVDFVELGPLPTFNVADAAITFGAAILVMWAVVPDRHSQDRSGRGGERSRRRTER